MMALFVCRGIKLIERNEEVCIFYEKVNIQGIYNLLFKITTKNMKIF